MNSDEFRPWNQAYVVTGGLILWMAWLFFNGASGYTIYGNPATTSMFAFRKNAPPKIMTNTFLCAAISGIVVVFVKPHIMRTYSHVSKYDCLAMSNGVITGLTAISACADVVQPWYAIVIGIISAFAYILGCKVMVWFRIDDPCEAFPVHLFGGAWGTLAAGLFDL